MIKYINCEAAAQMLREEAASKYLTPYDIGLFAAARAIESFPAADVRPVVLCRDCKYWKQWDNTTHYLCTYVAAAKFIRNADDFCSRGEREES